MYPTSSIVSSLGSSGLFNVRRYTPNTEQNVSAIDKVVICSFKKIHAAIAQNRGLILKIRTALPIEM